MTFDSRAERTEAFVVIGLASASALLIKAPELFGVQIGGEGDDLEVYARNVSLFVLPLLSAYFFWKRGFNTVRAIWLALPFAAAAVFANAFPFEPGSATGLLTAIHLPIVL